MDSEPLPATRKRVRTYKVQSPDVSDNEQPSGETAYREQQDVEFGQEGRLDDVSPQPSKRNRSQKSYSHCSDAEEGLALLSGISQDQPADEGEQSIRTIATCGTATKVPPVTEGRTAKKSRADPSVDESRLDLLPSSHLPRGFTKYRTKTAARAVVYRAVCTCNPTEARTLYSWAGVAGLERYLEKHEPHRADWAKLKREDFPFSATTHRGGSVQKMWRHLVSGSNSHALPSSHLQHQRISHAARHAVSRRVRHSQPSHQRWQPQPGGSADLAGLAEAAALLGSPPGQSAPDVQATEVTESTLQEIKMMVAEYHSLKAEVASNTRRIGFSEHSLGRVAQELMQAKRELCETREELNSARQDFAALQTHQEDPEAGPDCQVQVYVAEQAKVKAESSDLGDMSSLRNELLSTLSRLLKAAATGQSDAEDILNELRRKLSMAPFTEATMGAECFT